MAQQFTSKMRLPTEFAEARRLLEALAAAAKIDPDMTLGRLQALVGVAFHNSGPVETRMPIKVLWRELGGECYCAYGSFAHQCKMLSTRKVTADTEGLGLLALRRSIEDYREIIPELTPIGLKLVELMLSQLGEK